MPADIKKSALKAEDITELEKRYNVKFPLLFKAYLSAYHYECFDLSATAFIRDEWDESYGYTEHWIQLISLSAENRLAMFEYFFNGNDTSKNYDTLLKKGYIQIGCWGDGWGKLWLKTNNQECEDCELVWFDAYGNEIPALAGFRELLECFFIGKYNGLESLEM